MTQLNFTSFSAYNFSPKFPKINKESSLRFRLKNKKVVLLILHGPEGVDIAVVNPPSGERDVRMLKQFVEHQQLQHNIHRLLLGPTVEFDEEGLTLYIE